jgi:small subunit ribosomal protein S14
MAKTVDEVKATKKPKFTSRKERRCWRCGRVRGYMRRYRMCRICFRELATKGEMPGFKKASW